MGGRLETVCVPFELFIIISFISLEQILHTGEILEIRVGNLSNN